MIFLNILFFLTAKFNVAYIESKSTIRQASEKLYHNSYATIPVLDEDGHFVRVVSEGDIFRYMMDHQTHDISLIGHKPVMALDNERIFTAIRHDANIEDLLDLVEKQNFVPVVDDRDVFIGIVTRRAVLSYLKNKLK